MRCDELIFNQSKLTVDVDGIYVIDVVALLLVGGGLVFVAVAPQSKVGSDAIHPVPASQRSRREGQSAQV